MDPEEARAYVDTIDFLIRYHYERGLEDAARVVEAIGAERGKQTFYGGTGDER